MYLLEDAAEVYICQVSKSLLGWSKWVERSYPSACKLVVAVFCPYFIDRETSPKQVNSKWHMGGQCDLEIIFCWLCFLLWKEFVSYFEKIVAIQRDKFKIYDITTSKKYINPKILTQSLNTNSPLSCYGCTRVIDIVLEVQWDQIVETMKFSKWFYLTKALVMRQEG